MAEVLAQTPPILESSGPTAKERKYDRQLRLWAASGQEAVESANILLINSGPGTVGVETLKNLVLPGIGRFTIADEAVVDDADLGINFFLDESCLGKSRAQCCAEYLVELNPEVTGEFYPRQSGAFDLQDLLDKSEEVFTMIIYTLPLRPEQTGVIEQYGSRHRIPLIAVHSVGFYSYFRTLLPGTFPIVDTHPDETATTDLRLLAPWSELTEFASGMTSDMEGLDDHEHGHLPMVVILLHYLEKWKYGHEGAYPTSYAEKTAFRTVITQAMRRDNPEGGEENFEEAAAAVMKHVVPSTIPSDLKGVFNYEHPADAPVKSSFWIIANAVRGFYEKHQRLPVSGGLPDMKAQSGVYIRLQNVYKNKARQDIKEVLEMVRDNAGGETIEVAEVEAFCKNARFIKLINTAGPGSISISEVVDKELANDEVAAIAGPEMPMSLIAIYLALNAISHDPTLSAADIVAAIGKTAPALDGKERVTQVAEELARAKGGELHNISAVTGGMVAQEVIKIITKQYVPIDNTHIFCLDCASRNGLASSETASRRITCPLCEAQLVNARDVVVTNLNPTEDFKTSVLGGLSPGIVMECARRALNFWGFQTTQNLFYQQHLQKGLTERYVALGTRLDQTVSEANSEIETLHHKIRSLEISQDNLQRKNEELAQAYKDKSRKLLQAQELYDRVKKKAEMNQMQQAASDAIDMTIQAAPEKFRSSQMRNLAMPAAAIPSVGHTGRFDPIGVNTDLPRLNTHSFAKENVMIHKALQPLGGMHGGSFVWWP
ncbi:NEDD8-activating enzyme E1 regulatory subunit [Escovopsis weberi]|uniref:NEDD8-activating enzyme E1 regulatory subunit n=1 Tax=Escovopsis weberi TaxID=150374 RepID=A0A0M8MXE9_ESCWE|nr:NEDD8-activating enzyme E1 regulatory subunit [Escovopsis weberi]